MRSVCNDVAHFLAPSLAMRERFIAFGVPPDRISHSPYGFNRAQFQRRRSDAIRDDAPREDNADGRRVGFLGSLMISKGPHLAIEACRRLGSKVASIDLFGPLVDYHGDTTYRRHTLAPLLALDGVRHHGHLPHARVPDALASIDVLVVPSIWPENSPLVIGEAFLAGIPVVASRIGGIPEIVVHDRNGLLFEPGSIDDLTRALARLYDEPGLLHRLRAGIAAVRSIEDDVSSFRDLCGALVSRRNAFS